LVGDALRIQSLSAAGSATQPVLQIEGIELTQPQWRLLPFAGGWVGLTASALTASRVVWQSPRESSPGSSGAPRCSAARAAHRCRHGGRTAADDAAPWHDVHASVFIGDNEGTEHRIQGLSLHNDRLRLSADVRIGTAAPLPLTLQLRATPVTGTPGRPVPAPTARSPLHRARQPAR
jgi:hypothetical protein